MQIFVIAETGTITLNTENFMDTVQIVFFDVVTIVTADIFIYSPIF